MWSAVTSTLRHESHNSVEPTWRKLNVNMLPLVFPIVHCHIAAR